MYVKNTMEIEPAAVTAAGAANAIRRILVGPAQGWEGWVMRLFTLGTGGCSPRHAHPWPHIAFVHGGEGTIVIDGRDYPVRAGYVAFVPGGTQHQFLNSGAEDFSFLCIVPEEGNV